MKAIAGFGAFIPNDGEAVVYAVCVACGEKIEDEATTLEICKQIDLNLVKPS